MNSATRRARGAARSSRGAKDLRHAAFVAILLDQVGIARRQSRETDHSPRGLVAITAVDRIGEEALHGDLQERLEELLAVEIGDCGAALFQCLKGRLALAGSEPVEVL